MAPVSFGIIGGGWWSEVYLRICKELPDRFQISGMVVRRAEAGAEVRAPMSPMPALPDPWPPDGPPPRIRAGAGAGAGAQLDFRGDL